MGLGAERLVPPTPQATGGAQAARVLVGHEMDLDRYTLSARFAPIALILLPVPLSLAAWYPEAAESIDGLVGLGLWMGVAIVLAGVSRDAGKRIEPKLFAAWGGPPTTVFLRQRVAGPDPALRADALDRLRAVYTELVPSIETETTKPDEADAAYAKIVRRLRERTRDRSKFPLVFAENVSYGFRRNLLGLRWWGFAISLAGLSACAGRLYFAPQQTSFVVALAAIAMLLAISLFLILGVRASWVREAGFRYGEALLASTELLEAPQEPQESSPGR